MDGRRACAALVAVLALAGCGGGGSGGEKGAGCLESLGKVTVAYGETSVRFPDGAVVKLTPTPTPEDAQQLAPLAAGPGDPFAYKAVRRWVVAWQGGPGDRHLRAVERCLRHP